jgi:folate-binding protein YgfZ
MVAADNEIRLRLGSALTLLIAPAQEMQRWVERLPAAPAADAERAEIHLGLPLVSASLRGLFLPQMLNLDLLGAMSFDKGCYPGQEIIARTQNLGTVKRRLARFRVPGDEAVAVGEDILGRDGTNVGGVVRSAADAGRNEILGVVRVDALDGALHALDDRPLQRLDLPYLLP